MPPLTHMSHETMQFEYDIYNGVVVNQASLTEDNKFESQLKDAIQQWHNHGKQLAWLTLSVQQSQLIPIATRLGFVFHNCHEHEITLILRMQPGAYAPFAPTHTIGAGGLVMDKDQRFLVIREKKSNYKGFKLPGGILEAGELLRTGIEREVFEETGIHAAFNQILGIISVHPFRFDNSNIYAVCKLTPQTTDICINDTQEIEEAKWIYLDDFLNSDENSHLNKKMVELALKSSGLNSYPFEKSISSTGKLKEIFFGL